MFEERKKGSGEIRGKWRKEKEMKRKRNGNKW